MAMSKKAWYRNLRNIHARSGRADVVDSVEHFYQKSKIASESFFKSLFLFIFDALSGFLYSKAGLAISLLEKHSQDLELENAYLRAALAEQYNNAKQAREVRKKYDALRHKNSRFYNYKNINKTLN